MRDEESKLCHHKIEIEKLEFHSAKQAASRRQQKKKKTSHKMKMKMKIERAYNNNRIIYSFHSAASLASYLMLPARE